MNLKVLESMWTELIRFVFCFVDVRFPIFENLILSISEKTGAENDGNPLNKISGIIDMRSISIKKHDRDRVSF